MAWDIGSMLSGAGNFIQQKPEQFAIMADALGQGFDPNNAFAGIGTAMGKSSLANKARQDQKAMLAQLLGGQPIAAPQAGMVQPQVQPQANPLTPQQLALSGKTGGQVPGSTQVPMTNGQNFNFLTPSTETGPTGISYTRKPDGSLGMSLSGLAEPAPTAAQKNPTMRPTDLINFSKALSGGSDLTGLSPAEIGAITSQDIGIAEVGRKTMADLSDAQYKQGQLGVARANSESMTRANEALSLQRKSKAAMNKLQTAIAEKAAPEELKKLQAETLNLQHQAEKLDLQNAQAWERQTIINKLEASGGNLSSLSDGELVTLSDNWESLRNTSVTQKRLIDQAVAQAKVKQSADYADAVASAFANESNPAAAVGDINKANMNAPATSTRVLMYDDGAGIFNSAGIKWVNLPKTPDGKQITMAHVRANAKIYGMETAIQMALDIGRKGAK